MNFSSRQRSEKESAADVAEENTRSACDVRCAGNDGYWFFTLPHRPFQSYMIGNKLAGDLSFPNIDPDL